jgi:flagellar biosynthesis regulator FlaF
MMMEENQLKKQLKTKAIKINTDISKKKKQIPLDEKARKTNFEHLKRVCNMENS